MADHEKTEIDPLTGTPLSPHDWDGLRELETRPPRWWMLTYLVCCLWAVGYWVVYPAWPGLTGYTRGVLGWSAREDVANTLNAVEASREPLNAKLASMSLDAIKGDPDLLRFAIAGGRVAFSDNCAGCHGSAGQGQTGYPNLLDDDWLWGGKLEDIRTTVGFGIRSQHADTRISEMPAFGRDGILPRAEIEAVADYVLALGSAAAAALPGARTYADNCVPCHGEKGEGNREVGGPALADRVWLYGSDRASVVATIHGSRRGVMPAWQGRLPEATITKLAIYVHSLGGGE